MPIYEYKCEKCGKELEVMHKVSDPAPAQCPECQAPGSLQRLVSRTSFQLKGGGWYSDLYGSPKKSESSSSPGAPSATTTATAPATATPSTTTATTTTAPPAAPSSGSSGSGGGAGSSGNSST